MKRCITRPSRKPWQLSPFALLAVSTPQQSAECVISDPRSRRDHASMRSRARTRKPVWMPSRILLVFPLYSLTLCTFRYRVSGMTSQIRKSPIGPASAGVLGRRLLPSNAPASGGPAQTLGWGGASRCEPPSSGACGRSMSKRPHGRRVPPHAGSGKGGGVPEPRTGAPDQERAGAGTRTPC